MLDDTDDSGQSKILVVDDAPQNLKLLRVILKDAGHPVTEAASGEEALQKLKTEHPAAMILDVRMPGMTGYDVCRAIRRDPEFRHLPVIMLTALSQPEERIKGIEAGATDFISKPFNKKELLARVETSLALASDCGATMPQLPGAVLITARDWKIRGFSPAVPGLLGLPSNEIADHDLMQLLERRGVMLPLDTTALGAEPLLFRLEAAGSGLRLAGRCTPVLTADGQVSFWAIVLSPEESSTQQ